MKEIQAGKAQGKDTDKPEMLNCTWQWIIFLAAIVPFRGLLEQCVTALLYRGNVAAINGRHQISEPQLHLTRCYLTCICSYRVCIMGGLLILLVEWNVTERGRFKFDWWQSIQAGCCTLPLRRTLQEFPTPDQLVHQLTRVLVPSSSLLQMTVITHFRDVLTSAFLSPIHL